MPDNIDREFRVEGTDVYMNGIKVLEITISEGTSLHGAVVELLEDKGAEYQRGYNDACDENGY